MRHAHAHASGHGRRRAENGLLPISMYALGYHGQSSYHDFEGPSLDLDERRRLASSLRRNHVLFGIMACLLAGETSPRLL